MKRTLLAAIFVVAMTFAAVAERRVALVFSTDNYRTIRPLQNAGNDGVAIKAVLEALDFNVFFETDRALRRMRRALDDFRVDARGADVALVFYSGHGVEIAGENRLLPVDADASSLDALKASSLPLEEVRAAVTEVGKIGLVLLDACRNDPFGISDGEGRGASPLSPNSVVAKNVKPGLGRIGRAENVLFAFSAAPGETASDGAAANSPFTTALTKYLGTEGLEIRSVLTLVQQEVYDFSQGQQLPYVESGLPQLFFASTMNSELPERERLLLAMADITPSIRAEIERIAIERDMPLAPLYGALISSNASGLSGEDREKKLAEAAIAFVKVRDDMRRLASDDPRVTKLRLEAEEQLSLGAFDTARASLADAASIDAASRRVLKDNFVGRTLSEATTIYLSGGAARADLRYPLAIADYEKAASLFSEVDGEDIPANDRLQQIMTLDALGDIYVTVGNLAKARLAYGQRGRVSARRAALDPDNAEWQRDLSVSHNNIGDVLMAQGNLPGGLEAYEASLDIRLRLAAADPGNASWQRDLSVSHNKFGDVRLAQGNLSDALEAYQASLDIGMRLAAADPGNAGLQRDLSVSYNKIGDVLIAQGNLLGGLEAYEASLDIRVRLTDTDTDNAGWQRDLSASHDKIGDVLTAQRNLPRALEAYGASLNIRARLSTADPGNAGWQRDLSVSHNNIGDVLMAQGNLADGLEAYQASLDIRARLATADPGNAGWQRDLSVSQNNIGDVLMAQGNLADGLEAYQASLDIRARLADAVPGNAGWQRDLSVSHERIGDLLIAQGNLAGALAAYQASLDIRARLADTDPGNAGWQRDLIVSHFKMALAGGDATLHLGKAHAIAEELERTGRLAPSDSFIPGLLRKELGELDIAAE